MTADRHRILLRHGSTHRVADCGAAQIVKRSDLSTCTRETRFAFSLCPCTQSGSRTRARSFGVRARIIKSPLGFPLYTSKYINKHRRQRHRNRETPTDPVVNSSSKPVRQLRAQVRNITLYKPASRHRSANFLEAVSGPRDEAQELAAGVHFLGGWDN